jgi:hypothetical protein
MDLATLVKSAALLLVVGLPLIVAVVLTRQLVKIAWSSRRSGDVVAVRMSSTDSRDS